MIPFIGTCRSIMCGIAEMIEKNSPDYSREFSWVNQTRRHFELVEKVLTQVQTGAIVLYAPSNKVSGWEEE